MIRPSSYWVRDDGWLLLAIILILTFNMTGCMAGYFTFPTDISLPSEPPQYLSNVKISYDYDPMQFGNKNAMLLERTLRTRFHILDIKQLSKSDTHTSTDRFVIQPELGYEVTPFGKIWGIISVFSFGVIPAVADQTNHIVLTIIAPDGDKKAFRTSYTERFYNWLPFLLFDPDLVFIILNGGEMNEQDREIMIDAVLTKLLIDATPFIVTHAAL